MQGSRQRESTVPLEFDSRPFDVSAGRLPAFYMGAEAGVLYNRMRNGEKAEIYAFRLDAVERSYDAEKHEAQVFCDLSAVLENGKEDEDRRGFRVKYQPQMDNRYTGNDADGARIEIEEVKFKEYAVAFTNFMEFPVERLIPPAARRALEKESKNGTPAQGIDERLKREVIVGRVPLAPKAARHLDETVMVLAVCGLVEPYVSSEVVWQKSTSERLREYMGQYYYLHARLLELWFYDFETGNVFLKMRPDGAPRAH